MNVTLTGVLTARHGLGSPQVLRMMQSLTWGTTGRGRGISIVPTPTVLYGHHVGGARGSAMQYTGGLLV